MCLFLRSATLQPPGRYICGYNWYLIEVPMVQGDAETRIVLFQLCYQCPTPLLADKNDGKPLVFFEKDSTLRIHSFILLGAGAPKFYVDDFQLKVNTLREFCQNLRIFFLVQPNVEKCISGLEILEMEFFQYVLSIYSCTNLKFCL